jgi:hypothetical protein
MKLIFLDMDGVLNGDDDRFCGVNADCAKRLQRIIEATGAKLVISSAWRYMILNGAMTDLGFQYLLATHGIVADVVGHTCSDEEVPERGEQIRAWLRHNGPRPEKWLAIDDRGDVEFSHFNEKMLVQTDGTIGLTDEDVDWVIHLLGEKELSHDGAPRTAENG